MASKAVIDAVGAYLGTTWQASDGTNLTVIAANTLGEAPAAPFLQVQYPVASERHVGMAGVGNRVFREEGAIRVVMTVTRGLGQTKAVGWCDELRSLFRAQQFGGVTTYSPSPAVDNDQNDAGAYWVLSFSVPYFYDLFA